MKTTLTDRAIKAREMSKQQMECKIILQEITSEYDDCQKWTATCRCGWRWWPGTKKECIAAIAKHGDGRNDPEHLMTGPKIITSQSTISIPKIEFPEERWVWQAHNEGEEGEPWYHGLGRTEQEAIDDLQGTDDVRRMARWHQSEGFPRNAAWLEFFRYRNENDAD